MNWLAASSLINQPALPKLRAAALADTGIEFQLTAEMSVEKEAGDWQP